MNNTIFVDTWGWLTLYDASERKHNDVATLYRRLKDLRLKYLNQPQIFFTDLSSMVVMQEFTISRILTEDAHFIKVGLGFELLP